MWSEGARCKSATNERHDLLQNSGIYGFFTTPHLIFHELVMVLLINACPPRGDAEDTEHSHPVH